jgi:succinoglycan biosynthesis protein ExoA
VTVPGLAVVMAVRNEEENLKGAVNAVIAQEVAGEIEICIAVAPSDDRTWELANDLARRHHSIKVILNQKGTTSAGLNAAIGATSASVIARIDGHSEPEPGYLRRAVEVLERTGAVNVGGVFSPRGSTRFENVVGLAMSSRFGAGNARFHYGGDEGPIDSVPFGVFQREAIEGVGLFDETLLRNQDYELNWRLREAGGIVWFDPSLRVSYRPRGSIGALARQYVQYGWWKRVVLRRHPRSLRWRQVVPPATVLGVFCGFLLAPWWPILLTLPAAYAASVVIGSMIVGSRPSEVGVLLAVFPTMHLSWGIGFLVGVVRD